MERIDFATVSPVIIKHEKDYITNLSKIDKNILYECLLAKQKLVGVECRFLYWLSYNDGFEIEFPKPIIPTLPITSYELEKFSLSFLKSAVRKKIFNSLILFSNLVKESCKINSLEIIIGGSFIDINQRFPSDIDIVILYPGEHKSNPIFDLSNIETQKLINSDLDIVFLPQNFSLKSFKSFSRIMCLSNNLNYQTEDDEVFPVEKVKFCERALIKIVL